MSFEAGGPSKSVPYLSSFLPYLPVPWVGEGGGAGNRLLAHSQLAAGLDASLGRWDGIRLGKGPAFGVGRGI